MQEVCKREKGNRVRELKERGRDIIERERKKERERAYRNVDEETAVGRKRGFNTQSRGRFNREVR